MPRWPRNTCTCSRAIGRCASRPAGARSTSGGLTCLHGLRTKRPNDFSSRSSVFSGPEVPEKTLDRLEKSFGRFVRKPCKHVSPPDVDLAPAGRDAHLPMAREQVHVFLGHLGIRRTHPDFYVLSVMDH